MSTTAITFVVDANVQAAQAKLDATQQAFEDAAGGATKFGGTVGDAEDKTRKMATVVDLVDKRVEMLAKDMDDLSLAIARGGANVEGYKEALRRAEAEMDRLAGMTNRTSANFGAMDRSIREVAPKTRNVGQAALEASRAMEDLQYGIGGVINNLPSLISSLGGKAGLAGALSVVAVGAYQVYKNWDAIAAAFGLASADLKAVTDQIKTLGEAFDKDLNAHMATGRETLAELKRELRDFGKTKEQKTLEEQQRNIEDMERRLANLDETRRFRQAAANKAESERDKARYAEAKAILDETDRRAETLRKSLAEARQTFWETAQTAGELDEKRRKQEAEDKARRAAERAAGRKEPRQVVEGGDPQEAIRARWEEEAQRRREDANEAAINAQLARDDRILANEEMFRDIVYRQEKAQAERLSGLWEDYWGNFSELAMRGFGIGVHAAQDYFDAVITGQEDAEAKLAISLMRSAGDALVGSGIKLGGEAVVSAFTPGLQGLAAAQAGASAALITAGLGLGAGSTALGHVTAGGVVGQKLPERDDRSARDRGAAPSRGGMGGGSGGLVVNVSFGAGGPHPEAIAREIHKVIRTDDRRRGAA